MIRLSPGRTSEIFVLVVLFTMGETACRDLSKAATSPDGIGGSAHKVSSVRDAGSVNAATSLIPATLVTSALKAMSAGRTAQDLAATVQGELVPGTDLAEWRLVVAGRPSWVASLVTLSDGRIDRMVFNFPLDDHLLLSELTSHLGTYTKVAESKTSSVRFDRPAPGIKAFASLFSSKVLPGAIVTRVDLRLAK